MTVYFRPCGDITRAPKPRTAFDLNLYDRLAAKTGLAIEIDESVDYEDWMEPAAMLDAALSLGHAVTILPALPLRRAVCNPVAVIPGVEGRDFLIGRQQKSDPIEARYFDLGWPAPSATGDLANHYAELATFRRHAGRKVVLADMPGELEAPFVRDPAFGEAFDSTELGVAMAAFRGTTCIVKQVYPAKEWGLITFTIDKEFDAPQGKGMFFDEVGFHFARFEGDKAALLVQERITMTHETRFFVIGHRVVTGAANIESHTPQQGTGKLFDDVFEITRNGGEIIRSPEIAERLHAFAVQVASEIAQEAPALQHYVLDLALGADGTPLVIELNPAAQSGLYAIHATALFEAIREAAQIAPSRTPESWDPSEFQGVPEPRISSGLSLAEILGVELDDIEHFDGSWEDYAFED